MANEDPFGERLRDMRKGQGLSLRALAERSGVSVSQLSRLENGLRRPTVDHVVRISEGLGIAAASWFQHAAIGDSRRAAEAQPQYAPHPVLGDLWADANAWLSDEDWQDVRALVSTKLERQKHRPDSRTTLPIPRQKRQ